MIFMTAIETQMKTQGWILMKHEILLWPLTQSKE